MATPFRIKRSAVPGKAPAVTDLQLGELALNTYDGDLYTLRVRPGIGTEVIKVGGATEVEMMERKERLDDALNATRAAMQEGVVIGGGKSLIEAIPVLKDVEGNTINQGSKLLQYALRQPLQVLLDNGQNQHKFDTNNLNPINFTEGFGYNALIDTSCNLMESGIIDPVKVTRSSLQAAASIAGMVLTTEVLVGTDEVLV